MNKKTFRITVAAATVLLSSFHAQAADGGAIAEVAGKEISADSILPYLDQLAPQEREALKENSGLLNQTVRTLILRQVLLNEATASGWDQKPEVAKQLEKVREAAIAELYLQEVAKVPADYPSGKDVEAVYEARKSELVLPKQYRVAQIFKAVPEKTNTALAASVEREIREVSKEAATGDFSKIAGKESEEPRSAANGGEVGWLAEASIQPEIRKAIDALKAGQISEPVKLDDGWYLVKVLDVKESRTATLEEAKPQIVQALKTQRAKLNREAYLSQLQQQNEMAINEVAVSKLLEGKKSAQ